MPSGTGWLQRKNWHSVSASRPRLGTHGSKDNCEHNWMVATDLTTALNLTRWWPWVDACSLGEEMPMSSTVLHIESLWLYTAESAFVDCFVMSIAV